jgi:hypothetical protein
MTPQERDLITQLFARLQQTGNQPKDHDADTLIAQGVQQIPDAPYLLVQTVLIQDMALAEAQHRMADLERQVAQAASKPEPQPTSFLGGARGSVPPAGPWGRPAMPSPVQPGPAQTGGSAWAQGAPATPPSAVAPLAMPGASSGFLRQAATSAAGIAGGALLFQGISSLFGQHYGGMFSGIAAQPGLGETVINNYYDNPQPDPGSADPGFAQADDSQGGSDPGYASDDQDTGGGDFGSDPGTIDV